MIVTTTRTVITGFLRDVSGFGWVVDETSDVRGSGALEGRVFLGSVVLRGYEGKRVRIVVEELGNETNEREDCNGQLD